MLGMHGQDNSCCYLPVVAENWGRGRSNWLTRLFVGAVGYLITTFQLRGRLAPKPTLNPG